MCYASNSVLAQDNKLSQIQPHLDFLLAGSSYEQSNSNLWHDEQLGRCPSHCPSSLESADVYFNHQCSKCNQPYPRFLFSARVTSQRSAATLQYNLRAREQRPSQSSMAIRVNDLKAAGSTCSVHWDDYSGISSQGGLLAGEVCEKRNREVEPEQHEPFESTLSLQQKFHHRSAVRGRRLSNRIAAIRVPIKAWVGTLLYPHRWMDAPHPPSHPSHGS